MSLAQLYTKGAKVWVADAENVWKSAILLDNYHNNSQKELHILTEDSKELTVALKSEADLPPLRNPDILLGQNDLTSLSYLHEPAVLNNLRVRFCERNIIYTYCGIVLVAFNPYQSLPIYSNEIIRLYSGQDMSNMDPHIFAIGEEAYKRMSRLDENQSIIVSGESGAGKTVSAKYVMRYFATVCGSSSETQIEKRVLATNPIMEAIGNAKTTRNDNSSRFGKFIEIGFTKTHLILGANMRTYLLEKSRVVFQTIEERNYHIFYQICSNADDPDFKIYQLDSATEFHYTNQGNQTMVKSINDAEDFYNFVQALSMLGISQSKQSEIFRILSGILHLGNIKFVNADDSNESSKISPTNKSIVIMSKLFGVNEEQMRFWLCSKQIVSANETLTLPLSIEQSVVARDALAKHIYSGLFLWIVKQINKSLTSSIKQTQFIGVLDIYGFETFEVNSFEQFCINYANEKLQQQFCLHVFKLEQEEYVKEGINWSFIDFHDNQPCIDMIEGRLGIIDLLDEECKMVKGSDQNWCNKLYDKHGKSKHFSKPRMSRSAFIIHHFADDVEYQIVGFLEKNRDKVLDEHINIFKASEYELIAELFQPEAKADQVKSVVQSSRKPMKSMQQVKLQAKTVGLQFSESLNLLMETLVATTPHYVRCIKPNDFKLPFNFDPIRTVQQLRACGVLETIRISSAGYPSRWIYPDFFKRYRVLAKSKNIVKNASKDNSIQIVTNIINDANKYQFGHTKLFFRSGLVAYLEKLRSDRLRACSVLMQKTIKGWLCRRRYSKIKKLARNLQNYGRGVIARRHARFLLMTKSATKIRAGWLAYKARTAFLKHKKSIIFLQTVCRGYLGKTQFIVLHKQNKIRVIQKYIHSWLARRHFRSFIRKIVIIQSLFRKKKARKLFRVLKTEAKSVEHMSHVAKGLENKIFELQYKLNEKAKEINVLREDNGQVVELKAEVQNLRSANKSSGGLVQQLREYEDIIANLKEQLANEIQEKNKFIGERDSIRKEKEQISTALNGEIESLRGKLLLSVGVSNTKGADHEDYVQQMVAEACESMTKEIDMERAHHQRLIKDYSRLQQRFENLQHDVHMKSPQSTHRRSPSNISSISLESHSSGEKNDQDQGYGSVSKNKNKNTETTSSTLENLVVEKKDLGLLVRLQTKIRDLEKQNSRYRFELDRKDYRLQEVFKGLEDDKMINTFEAFKIQDLEMENHSIKNQLARLQKVMSDSSGKYDGDANLKQRMEVRQLIDQLEALKEQLKHKQNECIRFKTLFTHLELNSNLPRASVNNIALNEDGELTMAYESQKKLSTILESELQRLQEISILRDQDLHAQIDRLIEDNKKQQRLIEQNLYAAADVTLESTIQNEISRIANENLILHEEINTLQDSIKKLKKALIIYAKRLKSSDVSDAKAELEREIAEEGGMPAVKRQSERDYNGMLEYRKEDEKILINKLIFGSF